MESKSEDLPQRTTFLNEPKVSEHEVDEASNVMRKSLVSEIEKFVPDHERFKKGETKVTFSHSGMSSLVCFLENSGQKTVLKIPLKIGASRNEGEFLRAWEGVGVKVPHIFEEGLIGGQPYLLMEYVEALTLSKTYSIDELIQNHTYVEMGETLRKMHTVTSRGYGDLIDSQAEYPDLQTWLKNPKVLKERVDYAKERGLLDDEKHGSLEKAFEILFSSVNSETPSVYGHSDFHIGNVFATEPLTVFDPWPFLNHPYMDLARSIVLAVQMGLEPVTEQMTRGYFGEEGYDKQLLQAALLINAYMKLKYWHQTGQEDVVLSLQTYLAQRAPLLLSSD